MAAPNPSDALIPSSANGLSPAHPASGPSPFVSQPFSAATELILKRLRGEGGPLNPISVAGLTTMAQTPAYEDVRRTVLEGMRTSHNMDFAAATPPPRPRAAAKAPRTGPGRGAAGTPAPGSRRHTKSGGRKRKRARDDSDESAESSASMSDLGDSSASDNDAAAAALPAFPNMTQSGRKVVKPAAFAPSASAAASAGPSRKRAGAQMRRGGRSVETALCKRCGRGHSPASNMIVFCDGCDGGWHQMCHDPAIADEAVRDERAEWFCGECAAKRGRRREQQQQRGKSGTPISASGGGGGVAKNSAWGAKSLDEKRAHLSSFPHAHLVSLLLHATALHPSIPVPPPAPTRAATQPPFPPSATASTALFARATANPAAPMNFIRKLPPPVAAADSSTTASTTTATASTAVFDAADPTSTTAGGHAAAFARLLGDTDADAEGEDDDDGGSRASTPASPPYPRPGNGLMARLKSDEEDLEWLVGEEGEEEGAFSHVVFEGGV